MSATAAASAPSDPLLGMPNKRVRRTLVEMARIRGALFKAAKSEHPVTCRRLFYRLVGDGVIEKSEAEYQGTVIRLLGEMRENGSLPFEWIADHTRLMRKPTTFDSLNHALESTAHFYRRALWNDQSQYVEIWCEKAGLTGMLYPVTAEWDVPLMICGGSPSKTFLFEAAQHIKAEKRPTYLYYVGDHDPSGVAIRERVERDLRRYAPAAEIHFKALAVTEHQIKVWRLPTRPTKQSDPNARRFTGESVEVDAIPADWLRNLVENSICKHINSDALERLRVVERAEKETLTNLAHRFVAGAP